MELVPTSHLTTRERHRSVRPGPSMFLLRFWFLLRTEPSCRRTYICLILHSAETRTTL